MSLRTSGGSPLLLWCMLVRSLVVVLSICLFYLARKAPVATGPFVVLMFFMVLDPFGLCLYVGRGKSR